ncbi:hypothetical protein GPL04_15985, partial [Parabacteroides distasonis]|nr:hypothetical protein [Parabacteroides distasonis]
MMGSYAAYPEIPVCFPFVGFHRNQPVLALFMPTGHRNDMDDLTHPCHHLEESAHVLECKYSINSLVYWVTYVHNVVYSFYRS